MRSAARASMHTSPRRSLSERSSICQRSSLTSLEDLGEWRTSTDDASVLVLAAAASHAEVDPEMQAWHAMRSASIVAETAGVVCGREVLNSAKRSSLTREDLRGGEDLSRRALIMEL